MDILFDWRIRDIEQTANESKNRLPEIDSLRGDVGRLECAVREIRSEADGLRDELRTTQERIMRLEARLDEMANAELSDSRHL